MQTKMLSVIVPVYNAALYLDKCLTSLRQQTYSNLEIILIDDGSTDGSGALCDAYAEKDSRIVVIHQPNSGVSAARNAGISVAQGEYIAFVDSDDYIEPNMFRCLVSRMETDDSDAVFCGYDEIYENYLGSGEREVIIHSPAQCGVGDTREAIYQMMLGIGHGYYTIIANKVFRRACFQNPEPLYFDRNIHVGEDGLWLTQMAKRCERVSFEPTVFYHWVQHEGSASNSKQVTERRLSSIAAQLEICNEIRGFDKELRQLAIGKLYNDNFFLQVLAYKYGDLHTAKSIAKRIQPGRCAFFRDRHFSLKRKVKLLLCSIGMVLGVSGERIDYFMNVTTYSVKRT